MRFSVVAVTGFHNGAGFQPEAVFLQPTHNVDGDAMASDADLYRSTVHTPSGTLNQARWFGPQHLSPEHNGKDQKTMSTYTSAISPGYASYTNSELADAYRDTSRAIRDGIGSDEDTKELEHINNELEARSHPKSEGPSRACLAGRRHFEDFGPRSSGPLSGEWSGESIAELSDLYDMNLFSSWNADPFEEGYADAENDTYMNDEERKVSRRLDF